MNFRCYIFLDNILTTNNKYNASFTKRFGFFWGFFRFCETVIKCLGYDWVLLFIQEHLHHTTIIWGLKILAVLLSHQHLLQIFKESSVNGGWVAETDAVLNSRMDVALGKIFLKYNLWFQLPEVARAPTLLDLTLLFILYLHLKS